MKRTLNRRLLVRTTVVLLLAGVAVHLLHGVQVGRHAAALLEYAERAQQADDMEQAYTYYTHYLAQVPGDISALAKYGLALEKSAASAAERDRVVSIFSQVVQRDSGRTDIHLKLIHGLIDRRKIREAVVQVQALLPRVENKAELEHILGWCHEAIEEYDRAAAAFRRAIALAPGRIESHALLAEVLKVRLDDPEQAVEALNQMVGANPGSYRAYLARARFFKQHKNLGSAEPDLAKALELAPHEAEVLLAAADWEQARGERDKARAHLQKGWELHPKNVAIVKGLAGLEMRAGKRADAILVLRSALKDLPESFALQALLADLLIDEGKLTEAELQVQVLRGARGGSRVPDYLSARLAMERGQWAQAQTLLEKARPELDKGEWASRLNALLGLCHQHAGELERRLSAFRRAVDLDPYWSAAHLGLASALEDAGRLDESLRELQKVRAADLGKDRTAFVARLVRLLMEFNRHAEAELTLHQVEDQTGLTPELAGLGAEVALVTVNPQRALTLAHQAIGPVTRDYRDQLWLARIYHGAGQDRKAEELLRASVAAAPHTPDTWIALARQLTRMGKREAALELVPRIQENLPARSAAFALARSYEAMGLIDRAAHAFQQAIAKDCDDFVALSAAADFYLRADLPEKAVPCLRELLQPSSSVPQEHKVRARRQLALILGSTGLGSDQQQALDLLVLNLKARPRSDADERARAFVQASQSARPEGAIAFFETSARRRPLSADEHFLFARLLDAKGEQVQVREVLRDLLATDPDNPQYLALLIRSLVKSEEMEQARDYLARLENLEPASARTEELKKLFD